VTHYLLDTNHASPLVTLTHPLRLEILTRISDGHAFAINAPALTETLYGLYMLPRVEENMIEWSRLRQAIDCYKVDEQDAEMASALQVILRRKGWQLATSDRL